MKSLLSVIALAFGALTFQSCEDYPNGASRGYHHGGYYGGGYGGDHYDGDYYGGGDVVVSSGYREHDHGSDYPNEHYDRENDHDNRDDHDNRNVNGNPNADVRHSEWPTTQ